MTHPTETLIRDLHVDIESWIARGEGNIADVLHAAMITEFVLVNPDGSLWTRDRTVNELNAAKAAAPEATFEIRNFELIAEQKGLAVVTYLEAQQTPNGPTERRAIGALRRETSRRHEYALVRLQETWTIPPIIAP